MNRYLLLFLTCFLGALSCAAAKKVQKVEKITTETTLAESVDYHLTGKTNLLGAKVNLNSEDAWLFFDEVRPTNVIKDYASKIMINGTPLTQGENGQVCIYLHGAVVIPHSKNYKPLTIFAEKEYKGMSMQCELQSYYRGEVSSADKMLGEFNNSISSFKLKRGYMATLANNSDGTGYSRVFIADKEDIEIDLPELQNDKVSFIRVFRWEWPSKKGWCSSGSTAIEETELTESTWLYSWSADRQSGDNFEYVPIKQNLGWPGFGQINGLDNVTHSLGYNEPDHVEQSNVSVEAAIAQWPELMKSGLRLGSPACTATGWIYSFMDECKKRNYRVDYVAWHAYWAGKSPQAWYNDLKAIHKRTGHPLWIKEWNNGANWTKEGGWKTKGSFINRIDTVKVGGQITRIDTIWKSKADIDADLAKNKVELQKILYVLDTCSFVERYSIYNWVEDKRAMVLYRSIKNDFNGKSVKECYLTPAGEQYRDLRPSFAYNSDLEVIPLFNGNTSSSVSCTYDTETNTVAIRWNDFNAELANKHIVECSVDDGAFEELFSTLDASVDSYTDARSFGKQVKLSYRIRTVNFDNSESASDPISMTVGYANRLDKLSFGVAKSDTIAPLYYGLGKVYDESPAMITGAMSQNNKGYVLTSRINKVDPTAFSFSLLPWKYESVSSNRLTRAESVPYMAVPKGTGTIGTLSYKAGTTGGVRSKAWKAVAFAEPLAKVPVVFAAVENPSSNTAPMVIRISEVTTTGFKVRIGKEEAGSDVTGISVAYIAIEPGTTTVGDSKISVGMSDGAVIGNAQSTATISFGDTYDDPLCILGLQTSNDEITASLRYQTLTSTGVKPVKIRETSKTSTAVSKDQVGWIVISNSSATDVEENKLTNLEGEALVYPSVTADLLTVNATDNTTVSVYNLLGVKVMESTIYGQILDVSQLVVGNYILRTDKGKSAKFIKK